jgi:uncharacterized membrane protein
LIARSVSAQSVQSYERIENFDTAVVVEQDASIKVSETIIYTFPEGEGRHGIYRTIPLKGISVSDITVADEHGTPYVFSTSRTTGEETIKIGSPDTLLTGTHTYVISYKVEGAVSYGKDEDELYWNATGNEWQYPIVQSHQSVTVPGNIPQDALHVFCYAGSQGSTAACEGSTMVKSSTGDIRVEFAHNASLAPGEGVTIAVGFPKGIVTEPTAWQRFVMALQHSIAVILSVLFLILASVYSFLSWRKHGREPKGAGIIVAQYDVPEQLHPTEMAALLNKKSRNADISAELINLAVKGFIRIEKIDTKVLFFKSGDYQLVLLKEISDTTDALDVQLLEGVFGKESTVGETVLLSDLKNSFYAIVADAKKRIMASLIERGYFLKNPVTVGTMAIVIFIGGVFASFVVGGWAVAVTGAWYVIPILLIAFAIIAIFKSFAPRTKKGVEIKEYCLGLKEYLQIAEKDRINFHNAPEKKPELFEALLPYAMVLGVEKAWAKEFEDIYVTPPTWYVDPSMRGFNTGLLVGSFSNFNTAAASSFAAPATSASGGGGFSGGGAGGGGGGSW